MICECEDAGCPDHASDACTKDAARLVFKRYLAGGEREPIGSYCGECALDAEDAEPQEDASESAYVIESEPLPLEERDERAPGAERPTEAEHALARIADLMSNHDWNEDLCDEIADVLRAESYCIFKPH